MWWHQQILLRAGVWLGISLSLAMSLAILGLRRDIEDVGHQSIRKL